MVPCNYLQKLPNGKFPVLPGTWAFRINRIPGGSTFKFKAQYCVLGDKQTEAMNYFETYAPVVSWSTIRLSLNFILSNVWHTKQVEYRNGFDHT